jgi:polar amino acid transport system permease protein
MFIETIAANLSDWAPRLLAGLEWTFMLTLVGFCGAFALGLALEYMRTRRSRPVRLSAGLYITLARGIPLLVVLYLLYFALPAAGITMSAFTAGTSGLALVYGAYLAEVFRAGLNAVARGQREAALACGLTPLQTFRLVLLPQALRHTIAPLLVNAVSLLKDSSICALIAVPELTLASREIMSESFLPLHVFALTASLYFILAWPASFLARVIEQRLHEPRSRRRARAKPDLATSIAIP